MARILIKALENGEEKLAKDIIQNASYSRKDANSSKTADTALFFCCSRGFLELAKLLIEKCANVNYIGKNGATPLHATVDNGHLNVVRLLVEHKADINAKNSRGDTALHLAAYRGFSEIMQYLMECGADCRILNGNSFTAENEAFVHGHQDLGYYLRLQHNRLYPSRSEKNCQPFSSMIQLDCPSVEAHHSVPKPLQEQKHTSYNNKLGDFSFENSNQGISANAKDVGSFSNNTITNDIFHSLDTSTKSSTSSASCSLTSGDSHSDRKHKIHIDNAFFKRSSSINNSSQKSPQILNCKSPTETSMPSTPHVLSMFPTPNVLAVPSTPNVLAVPSTPNVLAVPSTPNVLAVPSTPNVLAVPSTPNVLAVPSTPNVLAVPSTPNLLAVPSTPNVLSLSSSPHVLEVPSKSNTDTSYFNTPWQYNSVPTKNHFLSPSLQYNSTLYETCTCNQRRPSTSSISTCYSDHSCDTGNDCHSLRSNGSDASLNFYDYRREDFDSQEHKLESIDDDIHNEEEMFLTLGVRNPPSLLSSIDTINKVTPIESPENFFYQDTALYSLRSVKYGLNLTPDNRPLSYRNDITRSDSRNESSSYNIIDKGNQTANIYSFPDNGICYSPNKTLYLRPEIQLYDSGNMAYDFNVINFANESGPRFNSNDLSSLNGGSTLSMTRVNIPLN